MLALYRHTLVGWLLAAAGLPAPAQDAVRGAQQYLRLDARVPSCITCHGPDPAQGRNNLLRAADNPMALQKALNAIGAMGYLKSVLTPTDVADLAAYLGRVQAMANPQGTVNTWPSTLEFGSLSVGAVSPEHRVVLQNRAAVGWRLATPRVIGEGFTLEHDCPELLAPGMRCSARIRAQVAAVGTATGVLLWEGDADWSRLVIGLVAEAKEGAVGALAAVRPDASVRFASLNVGNSQSVEWPLVSIGTQGVTLGNIGVSGPQASQFSMSGDCSAGRNLAPADTCTLQLRFFASAVGTANATLQVRNSGTNPATLELVGEGLAPAPDPIPAAAQPGSGAVGAWWLVLLGLAVVCLVRSAPAGARAGSSGRLVHVTDPSHLFHAGHRPSRS